MYGPSLHYHFPFFLLEAENEHGGGRGGGRRRQDTRAEISLVRKRLCERRLSGLLDSKLVVLDNFSPSKNWDMEY